MGMKTLYEWQCYRCHVQVWSTAGPQTGQLVKRVPRCPTCQVPTMKPTGEVSKVPVTPRGRLL